MSDTRIQDMLRKHQVLAEMPYEPTPLRHGYTDKVLRIDISSKQFHIQPIEEQMKTLWVGGKGYDLWLMLQEITGNTKWDDPDNVICLSSGPLGGAASFPGSGKTIVTTISPATESIMDSNVGGYFGPYLKFAGFDAMVLTGKADEDVIVLIDVPKKKITIEKAPEESPDAHVMCEELTEMYAENENDKRNIAVVAAGSAADHIWMGVLNFSFYDWRRKVARIKQAGRGGIGTVFRNKKIKAMVIKNRDFTPSWKIEEQPFTEEFKIEPTDTMVLLEKEAIRTIAAKWNNDPEYVIEMMQDIQDQQRYISMESIDELTQITGVAKAQLYHIATFYSAFTLRPTGKHVIQICVGTACHVKGATKILESFERELGIRRGETTKDAQFTLEAVACLGCCSLAPVVKVGDEIHGNVKAGDVATIIARKRGE
jgi:NADH:ubiquinone oxidoreductase subunit E